MRKATAVLFVTVFALGAAPAEAQYNPVGWVQTSGWNMLLLEQTYSCSGGGMANIMGNWVAPYELGEENPRAGDDWQIDFAEAKSSRWGVVNLGDDPTWVSSEWLESEGIFINTGDQVDFNSIAGQLGMVNDNAMGIATTYIENLTGESLAIELCTASDDSIRVDMNNYIALSKSACRGSSADCQERTCTELAPGMNKVTVYVWEGGGGWNFRFGVNDPATGIRLDDISGEDFGIIFHGNGDDDALEGQILDEAPDCFAGQQVGGGEAQPFDLGGWIGTSGWNFLVLDQGDGCSGGGVFGMRANWVAPYDLGEEDPRAGEEWDIDFLAARSTGWPVNNLDVLEPTWLSVDFLAAEGTNVPVADLVDYNAIAQALGMGNDNAVGIATTYVENTTDAPVAVNVCTASDDSIRVDINNFTFVSKSACRGSAADCQELTCSELAPGMNKITTYVWEGGGGWNFRLGLKDPQTGQLLSGARAEAAGIVFHGTGTEDELVGQVLDEAPGCEVVVNPGEGFPPIEEGANSFGWIRSSAWTMLLLDQNGGCNGGGPARMAGQWVSPYNMAEENPRAGEEWDIDFAVAESLGWTGRFNNTPTWFTLNYLRSLGNNLPSDDLVNFENFASAEMNGTDNKIGIATTYIENLTGDPQLVELCTASDDSIRVDVNNYMVVNKAVCRGSGGADCQERSCAELAPGMNKITAYVWEGGGGWNFRLGVIDPATGIRLDDTTGEDFGLIFLGTGEDDDLEGQALEVEPECSLGEIDGPGDVGPLNPLAAGVNPFGWVQSHAWNLLFLDQDAGCSGGGAFRMGNNWVAPYDLGEENPRPGEEWDIDFALAESRGWLGTAQIGELPTWVSVNSLREQGANLVPMDLVDFNSMVGQLGFPGNDNVMAVATTYVENVTGEPLPVQVCTASDDSIRVDVNKLSVALVNACRGSAADCQELNCAVLEPGMNKITTYVWEGGGGWNMRFGLRGPNGAILDDRSEEVIFHGDGAEDELEGRVTENPPNCGDIEIEFGVNPAGWIQTSGWNMLLPLLNPFGCGGGGAGTMEQNWVEPYEMIDEDPQAGDAWPDIDFGLGLSTGFDNGGVTEDPTWMTTRYLFEEYDVDVPALDLVNLQDIAVALSNSGAGDRPVPNDNVMGIATTYVINNLDESLAVDVCTGSDDSIAVHVNGELVTNVSACRGSGGDCQEPRPAVLEPGLNQIMVQVWEGGGGWNFRLGLRESGGFANLCDGNDLGEFLGANVDGEPVDPGGPDAEICDNGLDDDGDGDADCADADCADALNCQEPPPPAGPQFLRADSDANGIVNLTDAIFTLNYLFLGGREPSCLDASDSDNNGLVQLTDAIFLLNYLFLGGGAPPAPTNECGLDPEEPADGIGCERFTGCP